MNPETKRLCFKMSSLLDLGNIWLAHEVHLQVAAEHHHGVHQAGLEDGVVQREQQIVGLPTKIEKKKKLRQKIKLTCILYQFIH